MTEISRIQDQLRRTFDGDAWHGPSLMEVLKNVSAQQASARPIPDAHSIWEITEHIRVWIDVVHRRVNGEKVIYTNVEDWLPVKETTEKGWRSTLAMLVERHQNLLETLSTVNDSRLDELATGSENSIYIQLHGLLQHYAYHSGQIAILKKSLG